MNYPEASNLFGTIETTSTPEEIASRFAAAGWTSRKSGWHGIELRSDFAELDIEADTPLLLHGIVVDIEKHARIIADVLRHAGLTYSLECYGLENQLLFTLGPDSVGEA